MTGTTDPLLAVTRALTEDQQNTLVDRFTRLNPHYRGAEPADILEILVDSDSDLDQTEPFWAVHGAELNYPGVSEAARALIWSGQQLTVENMRALLTKAGLLPERPGCDETCPDTPAHSALAGENITGPPERDWRKARLDELIDSAAAAGLKASRNEPDAILMADARNNLTPGGDADRLAEALANDLQAKAPEPVTRATCAVLVRAACNVQGLTLLGYTSREILTILGAAAAKLEMRAKP